MFLTLVAKYVFCTNSYLQVCPTLGTPELPVMEGGGLVAQRMTVDLVAEAGRSTGPRKHCDNRGKRAMTVVMRGGGGEKLQLA